MHINLYTIYLSIILCQISEMHWRTIKFIKILYMIFFPDKFDLDHHDITFNNNLPLHFHFKTPGIVFSLRDYFKWNHSPYSVRVLEKITRREYRKRVYNSRQVYSLKTSRKFLIILLTSTQDLFPKRFM